MPTVTNEEIANLATALREARRRKANSARDPFTQAAELALVRQAESELLAAVEEAFGPR